MSFSSALAALKASLDQGNEHLTTRHFRHIVDSLNALGFGDSSGFITLPLPSQLTISGGVVTATQSYHSIETEAAAATDDLDTINNPATGRILIVVAADTTHTVVMKNGTGNLNLNSDFSMANSKHTMILLGRATSWLELSRSAN